MKEKVISTLTRHDGLKAEERAAFAEYLHEVFTKAEGNDALAKRTAALEARVAALEAEPKA